MVAVEDTDDKLVLQAATLLSPSMILSVRSLLCECDSPVVVAKVLVDVDALVVLYLRLGVDPSKDLLGFLAHCCRVVPFLSWNSVSRQPCSVWTGDSHEPGSLCAPVR